MKIPVNPVDIPTTVTPLQDNIVYTCIVRVFEMADKLDKNGNQYMKAELEIVEPADYRGKKLKDNYIGLPGTVMPDMDDRQRRMAMENGVRFACLLESAGVRKSNPDFDTDNVIGEQVTVTIQNEEFPKGSGRYIPRVRDYLSK